MVAAKFLDDLYYSNKHWARIGGLNLQEVNTLELKLLFLLSFSVGVSRDDYQEYLQGLVGAANIAPPPRALAADLEMEVEAIAPPVQRGQDANGSIPGWQPGARM